LRSDVFAYEYPGYGSAEGKACESGCYEAADAAFRFVTNELKVKPYSVVLYGRSLGSGPTVDLAHRQNEVAGVVLQSPLSSAIRTKCCGCCAVFCCCIDMFKSINKAPQVPSPVLIMHGTHDGVVPCANGEHLYKTFPNPVEPLWVTGAGHNDMNERAGREMVARLREFLVYCEGLRKTSEFQDHTKGGSSAGYEGAALPVF